MDNKDVKMNEEPNLDEQIKTLTQQSSNILNSGQSQKYQFLKKANELLKKLLECLNDHEIEKNVSGEKSDFIFYRITIRLMNITII